jgi:hypothetical protein
MEKSIGEDEIKGLEEEIDSAVDRLFVEKKGELEESVLMESPLLEPSYEIGKTLHLGSSLELESSLEPSYEIGKTVELERSFSPPAAPHPVLNSIEKMETQLLSLEWEITEENLKKTEEEVLALRGVLKEKSDAVSVLNLMEKVLTYMIKNEENIRPPLIKFLLDSKETIKLLVKKERDSEIDIYKQLAFWGIGARFSCLEEFKEPRVTRPPLSSGEETMKAEKPTMVEKKIEEMLNKMNLFSERIDESFIKINQRLFELERTTQKSPEQLIEMKSLPVNVIVFKIDERLFGVESDKVFKLFKVPDTFYEKYSNQQRIRLKDVEVKMIDLRKCFSMGGGEQKGEIRILAVKDNGEYKGLVVDQVLKKLSTHSEIGGDYGDYFLGVIHWTYEERSVEIPILDLKKL